MKFVIFGRSQKNSYEFTRIREGYVMNGMYCIYFKIKFAHAKKSHSRDSMRPCALELSSNKQKKTITLGPGISFLPWQTWGQKTEQGDPREPVVCNPLL